jgi:SH3-like domain-containing protein
MTIAKTSRLLIAAIGAMLVADAAVADAPPKPPYWASIRPSVARMRTGPARTYPASWLYRRADLPLRVVRVMKEWRQVEDHEGTRGWMQGNLLSSTRTAVVTAARPIELRERPGDASRLLFRAAPGVVGRLSECGGGWCRFDVKGQAGYTQISGLWGVEPGERLP